MFRDMFKTINANIVKAHEFNSLGQSSVPTRVMIKPNPRFTFCLLSELRLFYKLVASGRVLDCSVHSYY